MKTKTQDLIGTALDWAVMHSLHPDSSVNYFLFRRAEHVSRLSYSPSTDWAQGGPIIERETIALYTPMSAMRKYTPGPWIAGIPELDECGDDIEIENEFNGPTPLIAAMRCYVASKLGDEVDVPEELS